MEQDERPTLHEQAKARLARQALDVENLLRWEQELGKPGSEYYDWFLNEVQRERSKQ